MAIKPEPKETTLPAAPKPKVDPAERSKALKAISDFRKATAWQVHRSPLDKRIVDHRTKIHLPRSYLAADGEDVKTVWAGADLNQIVHQHYIQFLGGEVVLGTGANYVSPDGIMEKRCALIRLHAKGAVSNDSTCRHEYLGPDPRIAGYRFDMEGEVHIKWWDSFLQDLWMDKGKWTFDVKMKDDGKWVEIDD